MSIPGTRGGSGASIRSREAVAAGRRPWMARRASSIRSPPTTSRKSFDQLDATSHQARVAGVDRVTGKQHHVFQDGVAETPDLLAKKAGLDRRPQAVAVTGPVEVVRQREVPVIRRSALGPAQPRGQAGVIAGQLVLVEQLVGDELVESGMVEAVTFVEVEQELADRADTPLMDLPLRRPGNLGQLAQGERFGRRRQQSQHVGQQRIAPAIQPAERPSEKPFDGSG